MFNLRELFWPRLEPLSQSQIDSAHQRDQTAIQQIRRQSWRRDTDAALEEARRLNEAELERRKTVDTKAATYLTVVGVLTPILSTFGPSLSDAKESLAFRLISALLLILAVAYLVSAGLHAFHALRVGVSHRVDTSELTAIWSRPSPKRALIRQLLEAVYRDRNPVNEKVSSIKMTDEFLVRAFITFALLLAIQSAWKPATEVWQTFHPPKSPAFTRSSVPETSATKVCEREKEIPVKPTPTVRHAQHRPAKQCQASDISNISSASGETSSDASQ
jgi:hypothetical protein